MVEKWYVILITVLGVIRLCLEVGMHGKPRTGNFNAGVALASFLIWVLLAWLGGFFNCFN